ncbi:MAG: D-alanyl-D-alanine carboxypeptidase [Mobilicoccus sp.]|nr:D-alanyl-D-alanine carboxypeptidase [Mobilicoccus sp.]
MSRPLAAVLTTLALLIPGTAVHAAPTAAPAPASSVRVSALAPPDLTSRLDGAARSQYLGARMSGVVLDSETGTELWAHRATVTRMPASTQKVMTALSTLESMDPDAQLVTRAFQSRAHRTNIYLKGAGDPSLTSAKLRSLAERTAANLKAQKRTSVRLYADATIFPAPTSAAGWKASYLRAGEVQPVRGLTLARYRGADGSIAAARTFAAHLKAFGVTATVSGHARTPERSTEMAASWSAPVSALVARMLLVSDNDYAEYLLRLSALEAGRAPTWGESLAHQRRVLDGVGVPMTGYVNSDGSGLSRSNRMPVRTLAGAVDLLWSNPAHRQIAFAPGAMPRAGQTGTLRARYTAPTQRCARGRVLAKTGTLGDAVALAGVAQGVDGRTRVFATVQNGGGRAAAVRTAVDGVATAAVGCR